jgi:hypothetical protein
MPLDDEADVTAVFAALSALDLKGSQGASKQADFEDHFFYLGAIAPERFRHLQEEAAWIPDAKIENFRFTFQTWLYLLDGASDACVKPLVRALEGRSADDFSNAVWVRLCMLGAIGTPMALAALGELAPRTAYATSIEDAGLWLPGGGRPAVRRFTLDRRAVQVEGFSGGQSELVGESFPSGLAIADVVSDPRTTKVAWHYLGVDLRTLKGLPPLPASTLHFVSPRAFTKWTLRGPVDAKGRYGDVHVEAEDDGGLRELLDRYEGRGDTDLGVGELLPFDEELVYTNAHVLCTDDVAGVLGGPPIGLAANPKCPRSGRMMFFLGSIDARTRKYGDGFRSLLVCDDCGLVACAASLYN